MYNILIVDDIELNIRLLERIISKDINPIFFSANDIFQAMRIFTTQQIDLALIDVNLKNYSGYDIAIEMNKSPNIRKIPLIFITATEIEEDKVLRGYKVGAVDYIKKPINKIILNHKIHNLLKLFEIEKNLKNELLIQHINTNKIKKQLKLCSNFQLKLFPKNFSNSNISIKGYHNSYKYIGGDTYYWKKLDNNKYFIILLDVMGHSIYTSILAIYIRSKLEEFLSSTNDFAQINQLINELIIDFNSNLIEDSLFGINFFATSITILIDLENKNIKYLNAGHPPMFYVEDDKLNFLSSNHLPLGILEDNNFTSNCLPYKEDFKISLFTDGIPFLEALDLNQQKKYVNQIISSKESIYDNLLNKAKNTKTLDDFSLIQIEVGDKK